VTPTHVAGVVAPGAVGLLGALHASTPTHVAGVMDLVGIPLHGGLHASTPTHLAGTVGVGGVALTGVLYAPAHTYPAGMVIPGAIALTGVLYTVNVTYLAGATTQGPPPIFYDWVDQGASTPAFDILGYVPSSRLEYRLARNRTVLSKGTNIFIVSGQVTARQPADMSTVSRVLYGGHDLPDDLSSSEIALLVAAGIIQQI